MIKRFCNRCGKEIHTDPVKQCQNPLLEIRYINPRGIEPFDLCESCSEAIGRWLRGKNDEN